MRLPNGREKIFSIEASHDIVIVFGMTDDQRVLVIDEYYIAPQGRLLTLVAGLVEHGDHRSTAVQELREEAGCSAQEMVYLGSGVKGKYVTGDVHFYVATGVRQDGAQMLEPSEDILVSFVTVPELRNAISSGAFHVAYEIACAYRALDYLHLL